MISFLSNDLNYLLKFLEISFKNDTNCVKLITFHIIKLFASSVSESNFDKIMML